MSVEKLMIRILKFEFGDHVRISKYKNIFVKAYTPNWSEEVLLSKALIIQFHGLMLLMILMVKNYWYIL